MHINPDSFGIHGQHNSTKRQRQTLFTASCRSHLKRQFGLSQRKRALRNMARMSKPELEELKAKAQGSGSAA